LIAADIPVKSAKVAILGFTFKENCPDTRNTKVIDIVNELAEYGIVPQIADPQADAAEAQREYGLTFCNMEISDAGLPVNLLDRKKGVVHEQFKFA
jgi:UDP-N-acetyl-D-galactosamine dehydrogenase